MKTVTLITCTSELAVRAAKPLKPKCIITRGGRNLIDTKIKQFRVYDRLILKWFYDKPFKNIKCSCCMAIVTTTSLVCKIPLLARRTRPKGRPSAARDDRVFCIQRLLMLVL